MARVLVTEGSGFLGRYVIEALQQHGHQPELLQRPSEMDDKALAKALERVDAVMLLLGTDQGDDAEPLLLRAMATQGPVQLVLESTLEIYGEGLYADATGHLTVPKRQPADLAAGRWSVTDAEGQPMTALPTPETTDPSPLSRRACRALERERIARHWATGAERDLSVLRLARLFGQPLVDGDRAQDDISRMLAEVDAGQSPRVPEDGGPIGDWLHVRDAARAMRLAVDHRGRARGAMNIASGTGHRWDEVARLVASATFNYAVEPQPTGRYRADVPRHLVAVIDEARKQLGFEPEIPLENALGEMVLALHTKTLRAGGESARDGLR